MAQQRPADHGPAPVPDPAAGGRVRPVDEPAEAVIRALQDAATASAKVIAEAGQPTATDGRDDHDHVRVTMTGRSITGRLIDEGWAAAQTGHALGTALTQATPRAAASSARPDVAALHSETVDPSHFPGGRWPDPTTTTYADGGVKNRKADWSLKE